MRKTKITKQYCSSVNKSKNLNSAPKKYNNPINNNHTITAKKPAKKRNPKDWKNRYDFMRKVPLNEALLIHLSEELIKWVNSSDDNIIFKQFLIEYGIFPSVFDGYSKRCKALNDAKRFAFMVIAERRERKSLKREIDSKTMFFNQGTYDKEWAEREQYHAKLRNDNAKQEQKVIVIDRINEKEEDNEAQRRTKNIS